MPAKIKFTEEEKDEIIRLYLYEGYTTLSLEKLLGISDATILRNLNAWGIDTSRETRCNINLNKHQIEEIISLYKRKYSAYKIANKFGVSNVFILKVLREHGINTDRSNYNINYSQDEQTEIIRLYVDEGLSTIKIAKLFNTNARMIHTRLNQWGVDTSPVRYSMNHNFFNVIDTERKAFWLNFIATDGNVGQRTGANRISISLQLRDINHLQKFLDDIESDHVIRKREHKNHALIEVYSSQMATDLAKYGVVPRKSLILKPYYDIDPALARHYWRAAIDGDGCLTISKGYPRIILYGTWAMCNEFRLWTQQFVNSTAKILPRKSIYSYGITGSKAIPIIRELYVGAEVYLDRKYERAMEYLAKWG